MEMEKENGKNCQSNRLQLAYLPGDSLAEKVVKAGSEHWSVCEIKPGINVDPVRTVFVYGKKSLKDAKISAGKKLLLKEELPTRNMLNMLCPWGATDVGVLHFKGATLTVS